MLSPASRYECEVFLNPRLPSPPVGWRYAGPDVGFVWDIEATRERREKLAKSGG